MRTGKLHTFLFAPACLFMSSLAAQAQAPRLELADARRIWDQAPHNAFTDLVRFRDRWWCVFREATGHVSMDGAIRVITSAGGGEWESAALLQSATEDLRDPKISVTSHGELMLLAAGATHPPNGPTRQSYVWFSRDGRDWSAPTAVGDPNYWLWRVTWHKGACYGAGYCYVAPKDLRFYRSRDGRSFQPDPQPLQREHWPNEASLVFLPDDTALCLLRREQGPATGLLGIAKPPYRRWEWKDLGRRIGGPHLLRLPDGRLLAAVRLYDQRTRTSLCWLDPGTGKLDEALALPSGGDTSYAGLAWHDGLLWVSYYSSHEGKTAIYLAKVRLAPAVAEIGSRRELLLDDYLIERLGGGAGLRLHSPVAREAVFVMDKPWEGSMGGYPTVLSHGGRHRLYYRGWQINLGERFNGVAMARPATICLAESTDGVHWDRTPVDVFNYNGIQKNNIVWMGAGDDLWGMHGFAPFVDTNPNCPPEQRWKAVGGGWNHPDKGLYLMTSPDGVHWKLAPGKPFLAGYALDSHNTVLWNAEERCYRAYLRNFTARGVRTIMTATSPDLVHWSQAVPLAFPGAPEEQLYVNNVVPYYRAPHILVGFPARYVEREWSPSIEALPELEHRRLRAARSKRYGAALTDTVFMSSRDKVTFRRWGEAFIRPGLRAKGNWAYGDNYLAWGMLETDSDLPGGGRELSFYATEGYWRGESTTLRRYTLRIDGFVSLFAPLAGGEMVTRPLVFSGDRLSLNISTSAAGSARVEIQDLQGRPLDGYALDDCWEIIGDTLDYTVRWKRGPAVGALAGKPVRLRLVLKDADLYSLKFEGR